MPRGRTVTPAIQVELAFAYSTKRTHRFNAEDEDAPIQSLYIRQDAFEDVPDRIVVTVTHA